MRPTIQERLDAVMAESRQIMDDMRAQGLVHIRSRFSEEDQQFVIEGSPVPFPPDEDEYFSISMPFYARPSK